MILSPQVFECLTGAALFQVGRTPALDEVSVHIGRVEEHLGSFPSGFQEKCSKRAQFFDDSGRMHRVDEFFYVPVEDALRNYRVLPEEQIVPAAKFIRKCIALDPQHRPTAEALLADEWFSLSG